MRYEAHIADGKAWERGEDRNAYVPVKTTVCCIQMDERIMSLPAYLAAQYEREKAALNDFLLDHEQTLFFALTREHTFNRIDHPYKKLTFVGELGAVKKIILAIQRFIIEQGDGTLLICRVHLTPYRTLLESGCPSYELEILSYFVTDKEQDPTLNMMLRNYHLDRILENI